MLKSFWALTQVIFPKKNSLNNKFIPYDAIETEAVLTLDDEIQFEQEELLFGFHVWTENRDRLIGYMARYRSWDERHKSWHYTWSDACEISLTLTCKGHDISTSVFLQENQS